jgi:hypothetical protein
VGLSGIGMDAFGVLSGNDLYNMATRQTALSNTLPVKANSNVYRHCISALHVGRLHENRENIAEYLKEYNSFCSICVLCKQKRKHIKTIYLK